MHLNIPEVLRAETAYNYLKPLAAKALFKGPHLRNSCKDVMAVAVEDGLATLELARKSLYDILPEAMFHPVDRFDGLPEYEYKEHFAREVERQHTEEAHARAFFDRFDNAFFTLSSTVAVLKDSEYSDNSIISRIICDNLPQEYRDNRFVRRSMEFMPHCRNIRGNIDLITLMLRKILAEENLMMQPQSRVVLCEDPAPRYDCCLQEDTTLGNCYAGNVYPAYGMTYKVEYWSEDACDCDFPQFVNDMQVYRDFLNDFFMGIGTGLDIEITCHTLPVRVSDDMLYNYLNYNTNL